MAPTIISSNRLSTYESAIGYYHTEHRPSWFSIEIMKLGWSLIYLRIKQIFLIFANQCTTI